MSLYTIEESTEETLDGSVEVSPVPSCRRVWFDLVPRYVVPDCELGLTGYHEPGMFDSCVCIEDLDLDLHMPIVDLPPAGPPCAGSVDPPTLGGSTGMLSEGTEETAEPTRICRPEGAPSAARPQRRMRAVV